MKQLGQNILEKVFALSILAKSSILNVSQNSRYALDFI